MDRCKTCKHWTPEDPSKFGALLGAGECQKAPQMWNVTDRVRSGDEWNDGWSEHKVLKPEHAAVLAVVEDGSAYSARLVTMADFGCVQHEKGLI